MDASGSGGEVIETLQQLYIPQATVLRMTTPKDVKGADGAPSLADPFRGAES